MSTYKLGSKGDVVKLIQEKLGLKADGIFGKGTEAAVKEFQKNNGLVVDGIVGQGTLTKMGIKVENKLSTTPIVINNSSVKYEKNKIENAVKSKGYKWFEGNDVLNIVGIRNSDVGSKVTNLFDDKITVSYQSNGEWIYKEWDATTDPGTKGVKEFKNVNGVARLVEGQYINSHSIGLHQGKYEALRQTSKVKVYRDKNRDMIYDTDVIQEGIFGINIHKAGTNSTFVENWSEGCQVFKKSADFEEFMNIVRLSAKAGNKNFTYTLIESKDIV
jgi:peptidoglycan hydrolase-like protein with peptidoglycan-binding domain